MIIIFFKFLFLCFGSLNVGIICDLREPGEKWRSPVQGTGGLAFLFKLDE